MSLSVLLMFLLLFVKIDLQSWGVTLMAIVEFCDFRWNPTAFNAFSHYSGEQANDWNRLEWIVFLTSNIYF